MTYDHINPSHYKGDRQFEPIDVIEDWGLNYHLGNALKYIARNGRKPGEDPRQGLAKAVWYLERLMDKYTEEQAQASDADELIDAKFKDFQDEFNAAMDQVEAERQNEREFEALGEIPNSVLFGADDVMYLELGNQAAQEVPFDASEDIITFDIPGQGSGSYMKGDAGVDTIHFPTNHTYKKDLSKFEDQEIVTTHFVDGAILGTQKNGDVVVLGKTDLYDEVKKADPLDLAPSEFEPDYDFPASPFSYTIDFDR